MDGQKRPSSYVWPRPNSLSCARHRVDARDIATPLADVIVVLRKVLQHRHCLFPCHRAGRAACAHAPQCDGVSVSRVDREEAEMLASAVCACPPRPQPPKPEAPVLLGLKKNKKLLTGC